MQPIRSGLSTGLLAATALLLAGGLPSHAEEWTTSPDAQQASLDGTLTISGRLLGVGLGYKWGRGTLYYQGQQLAFCIHGLSVGDLGVARLTAYGNVFNLMDVDDFSGRYVALSTGAALGHGASAAILQNQHGVAIELHAKTVGVRLGFGASDVRISLVGTPGCSERGAGGK